MRFFLDTEFNGFCGDLVSIALVPEDPGRPAFYEAIICDRPEPWVAAHVIPVLGTIQQPRPVVAEALADYLAAAGAPVIVADWPEDVAHLARLLIIGPGRMLAVPKLVFELADVPGFDASAESAVPHNACADARALMAFVLRQEAFIEG
ncbi:hypothetical protein [Polymorphobacter fuscus]|uniref:Uncharacterized protein n=1 Tax=Sandarakinorhabdus fusca TaxID=1439888 RepID=A0A7C9KLE8_9SPHN|nr:hypothetical protein [Polymorphobacter fuscus]KAB7647802.1 hypothetical protein F9290_07495 [Polymorphobacter fuscus]MQT17103.1 hypothetical protein [Polymorphobacter fuscus]NJC08905.1 hypothetical protein [Polymorphobacter fuscus]